MKKKLEKSEFSDKFNKIHNQDLERVESEALEDLWSISDPNDMQSDPPGYQIPPLLFESYKLKLWEGNVLSIEDVLQTLISDIELVGVITYSQHQDERVVSEITT